MNKIRLLRTKLGLSQNKLADNAGVGVVTIIRLESGGKVRPINLVRVAEALGVDVEELLEFEAEGANKGKPRPPAKPKAAIPPLPAEPVVGQPVTLKFSKQDNDIAWKLVDELGLTISQVKGTMKKLGLVGKPSEEVRKAVIAERFKKEV